MWQQETVDQWFKDGGDQKFRIDHYKDELVGQKLIVEVGACDGVFTRKLALAFPDALIIAFEPIKMLAEVAAARLKMYENVSIYSVGLSVNGGTKAMTEEGPASRITSNPFGRDQSVDTWSVGFFFDTLTNKNYCIDLLVLNIEGAEYDILDRILAMQLQRRVNNFQIQFHDYIDNASERMENIQNKLSETHELTYQYPFCFENWRKK